MSIFLLNSCDFTKWDNHEELIGKWETSWPSFMEGSEIIFYEDGTCDIKDIPTRDTSYKEPWPSTTLKWWGSKEFEEKQVNIDKWNFSGYWKVKEDTLYDIFGQQYYRYRIQMSPYREMIGTKQECDSFMNCANVDNAFGIEIGAWTESLFPPACLQYLYYYIADPDDFFVYVKKKENEVTPKSWTGLVNIVSLLLVVCMFIGFHF